MWRWEFLFRWRVKSWKVFLEKKESNKEEEDKSSFLGSFEEEGGRGSGRGSERWKELSELRVSMKDLDPLLFLKTFSTFLSSNSILKILSLFFKFVVFFWKPSNSSSSVSSKVKISDTGNLDESRKNWTKDENLGTKIEDGSKDGGDWIKEAELFLNGGEILLKSGALQGLLLGLKEVSDFPLESKLDVIRVIVKNSRLDFFLLGRRLQTLDEELAKESNEESSDLTEEVLFFGKGEEATKTLGLKLDDVWSSFSNEGICFWIEKLYFSNERFSFLDEEIS